MVERREEQERGFTEKDLKRASATLAIDRDDLDRMVAEHPQAYFDVAEATTLAHAERDAIKQDLTEMEAFVARNVRAELEESKRKMTNDAVEAEVRADKRVQKIRTEFLAASALADRWSALKEAFGQRSYMLRELVGTFIARHMNTTSHTPREELGDYATRRVRSERATPRRSSRTG